MIASGSRQQRSASSRLQGSSGLRRKVVSVSNKRLADFRRKLLCWYSLNGRAFPWRRKSCRPYERIVSEVLLQRTRAETVSAILPRFVRVFPSWQRLARANTGQLRRFLKPLGLWRRRASSIRALATEMGQRRGRFPKRRDEIEQMPGVGQYIANAILLFVFKLPSPLLDVNMARVLERRFGKRVLADIRHDPYLQHLSALVVAGSKPEELNWAVLDLGALVCKTSTPKCEACPVRVGCKWAESHRQRRSRKNI